ncbi:MAG: hypothetical protein JW776_00215 [Candidatus Lokiarchaeota archaeon]|nr:hypothetical protein [Candidatus Lokiarchaeota archaeon]
MIFSFFIMRSTGETIFVDDCRTDFNVPLLSGFISALFSFLDKALHTTDIFSLDVALLRFIFSTSEIGNSTYYFVLLVQRIDTLSEYQPKLNLVKHKFIEQYSDTLKNWTGGNTAIFEGFRKIQRQIFETVPLSIPELIKKELSETIKYVSDSNDNLKGVAILSPTGSVIVSSLNTLTLIKIIEILEGRYYTGAKTVNQLISKEEEGILVLIGGKTVILATIFDKSTPLGTTLVESKLLAESLNKIIEDS